MLSKTGKLNPPKAYKPRVIDLNSEYWHTRAEKSIDALDEAWNNEAAMDAWYESMIPDDASCYLIDQMCRYKLDELKVLAKVDPTNFRPENPGTFERIDRNQQMHPGIS